MRFYHSGPEDGDIPPEAYQLADHLDAALAAAEDLADAGRQWAPASAVASYEVAAQMAAERQVIERVRMFETVLIGRVLKARKRARVLARTAGDLAGMTRLFVGGTTPLLDAVEELGDSTRADFETGDCHIAYLRQRGVIAEEDADLPDDRAITLGGDQFLVAGRIALAPLTAMIIAFLDALDMHYDLYPDEPDGAEPLGWEDAVGAARCGDVPLKSCTHNSYSAEPLVHEECASDVVAAATVQGEHDSACTKSDAAEATHAVEGAPSMARPRATKGEARSLVERLDAVARALE